jgi:hypothetical protein
MLLLEFIYFLDISVACLVSFSIGQPVYYSMGSKVSAIANAVMELRMSH